MGTENKVKRFTYKGMNVVIDETDHHAVNVSVNDRVFRCHHHHPPKEGAGLAMWMCDEAYFATPTLRELAQHFADYGYLFDDPRRVRVDDEGNVVGAGAPTPGTPGHAGGH